MTLDEGHYYIYFLFAITYGKVILWLWKSLENPGNFFSPTLWPPCPGLTAKWPFVINILKDSEGVMLLLLPSPLLSEWRRYCLAWRHAVCVSTEPRLHAALVSAAK